MFSNTADKYIKIIKTHLFIVRCRLDPTVNIMDFGVGLNNKLWM